MYTSISAGFAAVSNELLGQIAIGLQIGRTLADRVISLLLRSAITAVNTERLNYCILSVDIII